MADSDKSFIRSLCMGHIESELLVPYPTLAEEERETLTGVLDAIDELLEPHAEDFRTWDAQGEMPTEFVDVLKDFGLFGLVIPEDHGGLGFGATAYSRTLQQVARHDASVAVTIGAHSSIGMRGLLLFGTPEQQERWLPDLATGDRIAAFCLTEPSSGSDAGSVRATAVRDGDDWVINGNKLWITNGGIAQFFTVFAKTGDPDERQKLSAFIVPREADGVSVSVHEDKMGIRASSTTSVFLDNVRIPADHLLGEEGKGFKVAMHILNSGRTGLGGGCVGGMKRLIELSTNQASEREQFGRPIAEFGLIKKKLGEMVVDCYAAEAAVNVVNGLIDSGRKDYAVEAAISKIFATEALGRTADEALQIAGGNGYMREYPYERFVRDSRINRIFEGTNEVLRLFVALTAMNDVGTQLKELSSGMRGIFDDPIKGFGVMSEYARKRASLRTGIGQVDGTFTGLAPEVRAHAAQFEASTRQLARAVDRVLRKHGKHIIGKQFASSRLANIMIDLFVWASVLSRVSASVQAASPEAAKELEILVVFSTRAKQHIDTAFARIDENDDELIKSLADHALEARGFSWDNV